MLHGILVKDETLPVKLYISGLMKILILIMSLGYAQYTHAYYIIGTVDGGGCIIRQETKALPLSLGKLDIIVPASVMQNLQAGRYYHIYSGVVSTMNVAVGLTSRCVYLGPSQALVGAAIDLNNKSDSIATLSESSIVNLPASAHEFNSDAYIFRSNITGLFFVLRTNDGYRNGLIPFQYNYAPAGNIEIYPTIVYDLLMTKDFKGVTAGTSINISPSNITLKYYDAFDASTNNSDKGYTLGTLNVSSAAIDIKPEATCQYSLSNNGIVDFGNQGVKKVTADRATTLKSSLTLNMTNCYGVNKVKTTITTTGGRLNSGQLLANTLSGGATNLGLGLSISPTAPENKSTIMYMDGTHPLNWTFNGVYSFQAINKSIPLDVYLLKSGGEVTPGDFKATATIMMDFI